MNDKHNIGSLFDRIASKYDFLNHLLSLNIDKLWRKKAIKSIVKHKDFDYQCLDVAIGTGDLAIELASQLNKNHATYNITGIDLSAEMMRIGEEKVKKLELQQNISFMLASALDIPFGSNTYDIVTCAYGVRNFSDLDEGLIEMHRVLKPGGQLMILEFSQPDNKCIAWIYNLYFSYILPAVGRFFSKDKNAYTYLNRSVKNFVWGKKMCDHLADVGFRQVAYKPITFGITTIYIATK